MSQITLKANQIPCYEKAIQYNDFLIAAKPRFGKTFTATKIMVDWGVKILVIVSGKNVRDEWAEALDGNFDHIIYTNKQLNNYDLDNLNEDETYAFFVSTQKAGRNIFEKRDDEDFVGQSNVKLINAYNKFNGLKGFIVDEAHFAEQTERSQEIIGSYNYDKRIYLSGTPYTSSITKQYDADHTFRYTILDEKRDYDNGLIDSIIKMNMYVVDTITKLEEDGNEDWEITINDPVARTKALTKIVNICTKLNSHDNLLVCRTIKEGMTLMEALKKLGSNIKVKSAVGGSNRLTSVQAEKFYKENPLTINFVVTCDRLCTGSTIRPLQSVIFCCPTRSAIKFIQTSMRCCSPFTSDNGEQKSVGNVICCNKFASYQVYCTMASLEGRDKNTTNTRENEFNELTEVFPIMLVDEDCEFRSVSYADATNFEEMYVHGKTKFFTDLESLEDLQGFNLLVGSLKKALQGVNKEAREAIQKAAREGGLEEAQKEANKYGVEIDTEEPDLEKTRELMQENFTAIISNMCFSGMILTDEYRNVIVDSEFFKEDILNGGWESTQAFNAIIEAHPEYARCIYNYYVVQFMNCEE